MNPSAVPSDKPTEAGGAAHFAGRDLYRLLELSPFESNPAVISSKVRELMREARKYQLGIHAARTQSRMEEIAAATACLLDPSQKQVYDEELRRHYGMPPVSVASTYSGPIPATQPSEPAPKTLARGTGRWQRTTLVLVVIAVVALIAWGFRLFTPASPDQATPIANPAHPGPAVVKSAAAATVGAERAAAAKHLLQSNAEKSPVVANETVTGTVAAPAKEKSAVEVDPFITAIQGIVADNSGPDFPDNPSTDPATSINSPGKEPRVPADNSRSVDPPTHLRPAPPSSGSGGANGQRAVAVTSPSKPKRSAGSGLHLTPNEVLRELRDVRLKRTPALRLSNAPRSLGSERVVELVRYARTAFDDDHRFQRQLDQEVVALKRVYPQLRDLLPSPAR